MAYMSQENKAKIAAALKLVVPKGWKYSLSVHHHSTIVMTISAAPVDLIAEYNKCNEMRSDNNDRHVADGHLQVNHYWIERQFSESLPVFEAIHDALNDGNWNKSDIMTDYFNVGWYVHINIGKWDKPFVVSQKEAVPA